MAVNERGLGGVPSATLDGATVYFYDFVRFDFPSPTNTLRYTNKPSGFVGNIDGGSQTWVAYDMRVGAVPQSMQSILDVGWLTLQNVDNVWSDILLNKVWEFRPIYIWQGWFNPTTEAFVGNPKFYEGRTEKADYENGRVRVSFTPHRSGQNVLFPNRVIGPNCGYIFKDTETCQYVGATVVCDHTRAACAAMAGGSNLAHFGGFDLLPSISQAATVWKITTPAGG